MNDDKVIMYRKLIEVIKALLLLQDMSEPLKVTMRKDLVKYEMLLWMELTPPPQMM
jgi:hypothetical protein